MINFFDKLYYNTNFRNNLLRKFRVDSIARFLIRRVSNIILPIYFKFSKKNRKYNLNFNERNEDLIVSLTSFPDRIENIWITIESLLRQSYKPNKVTLWLSKDQFLKEKKELPKTLMDLEERGLEIIFVEGDIKSHKKYFYAMQKYPNSKIITVDDDVIYNTRLIENLIDFSYKYSKSIICNRAAKIGFKSNNKMLSYSKWENLEECTNPTFEIMPIGIGGVLYPPNSLHKDYKDQDLFMKLCPYADDIWLNVMSRLRDVKNVKTAYNSFYLPVLSKKKMGLYINNVGGNKNDIQIKAVSDFYINKYRKDPFVVTHHL